MSRASRNTARSVLRDYRSRYYLIKLSLWMEEATVTLLQIGRGIARKWAIKGGETYTGEPIGK